ncbi:MAG: hypothetical protein DWH91_16285 [Planctomycetota bacterium]|nr:MAG: hypothetical protein DWH91_16285 [Planctomycetota bacterium]
MTPPALLHALIHHCRPVIPDGTTILQPGDALTITPSAAWAEFWIDRISTPIARRVASVSIDFNLTINCFGRPPTSSHGVSQLAEQIRLRLCQATLTLSGDHAGGYLKLAEPECRDLSRPATAKAVGLWHWLIAVRGTAPG